MTSLRAGAPRSGGGLRKPGAEWLPRQHGAWAMLLVPAVVGAVRGGTDPLQLVLVLAMLAAYGLFNAGGLAVRARHRERYARPLATYGVLAAGLGLVALVARPALLMWLPVYAVLGLVTALLTWRRRERSLLNDAVTILAACLFAGVLYQAGASPLAAGDPADSPQWRLLGWVVVALFAYFFGTALYVKTVIRERGNAAYHRASVAYHAGWAVFWAVSGNLGVPIGGGVRVGLTLLFVALTVRAKVMAGRRVKPLYVGLGEIVFSALVAVLAICW